MNANSIETPSKWSRYFNAAWVLFLALLVLAVYRDSLQIFLFLDDIDYFKDTSALDISRYLPAHLVRATYNLLGLNTTVLHAYSVAFHLLNTILVFFFTKRITKSLDCACLTSVVFATFTNHCRTICWISCYPDLMSTLFSLISLLCFTSYLKKRDVLSYTLSFAAFLLALYSKQIALVIVVLMPLLEFFVQGERADETRPRSLAMRVSSYLPYLVVLFYYFGQHSGTDEISFVQLLEVEYLQNTARFAKDLLVLVFSNIWPPLFIYLMGGALLIFIVAGIVFSGKRRLIAFFAAWYIASVFPISAYFHPMLTPPGNRYFYLPSIGIFILISMAITIPARRLFKGRRVPRLLIYFVFLLSFFLINYPGLRSTIQAMKKTSDEWRQYTVRVKVFTDGKDHADKFNLNIINYNLTSLSESDSLGWIWDGKGHDGTDWQGYQTFMMFLESWTRWILGTPSSSLMVVSDRLPVIVKKTANQDRFFCIGRPKGLVDGSPYYLWQLDRTLDRLDRGGLERTLASFTERYGAVSKKIAMIYLEHKILDFFTPADDENFYEAVLRGVRLLDEGNMEQGLHVFEEASEELVMKRSLTGSVFHFRPMLLDKDFLHPERSIYRILKQEKMFETLDRIIIKTLGIRHAAEGPGESIPGSRAAPTFPRLESIETIFSDDIDPDDLDPIERLDIGSEGDAYYLRGVRPREIGMDRLDCIQGHRPDDSARWTSSIFEVMFPVDREKRYRSVEICASTSPKIAPGNSADFRITINGHHYPPISPETIGMGNVLSLDLSEVDLSSGLLRMVVLYGEDGGIRLGLKLFSIRTVE
ncbi:ArnT family glycosyltransferase [Thermodesulfobacteriota bacterium]